MKPGRVRIVSSDGTPNGTRVLLPDGTPVPGVRKIEWSLEAGSGELAKAVITVLVEIDVVADQVQVQVETPPPEAEPGA